MASSSQLEGKRITLKRSRPNPLFEDWLDELYEEAKAKKSKLESKLKEALESLSKYPLPLESGMECLVLKGFDRKLCMFLDKRIETYNYNSQLVSESSTSASSQDVTPLQSQCNSNGTTSLTKSNTATRRKKRSKTSSADCSNEQIEIQNQLNESVDSENSNKKVSKSRKEYKPVFRSGSYAILVALLEQLKEDPSNPSLQKDKLIEKAQPHSEESFTRPKPESFYTAWSNMSRLVNKGLVEQVRSKKTSYSLTDDGIALAIELLEDAKTRPTVNDIIFNGASTSNNAETESRNGSVESTKRPYSNSSSTQCSQESRNGNSSSTQCSQATTVTLSQRTISELTVLNFPPGSFNILLLIDKQETGGNRNKNDPTVAQFNKYPDLKHEYRNLKVGDYTWIARHKAHSDQELVLPYVVERKRMDDLGSSIKDGRFHEQKYRLRKCGLPHVIYLIENFGSNKHVGLPIQSLMQALANTRVQDGFKVHTTDSLTNTARFLAMMTKRLTMEYKDKHLTGSNGEPQGEELMIFNYFNKSSTKNKPLTVTETFIKLLLQLKGVSVEKALAITRVYSTPKALIKEYGKSSQKEGETLLAQLKYGNQNRNVGPMVSKAIYKFFTWKE